MKLTARSEYALLALVHLGRQKPEELVSADTIARAQRIPPKFLEQILLTLKRAKYLRSTKGPRGGYQLAKHLQMTADKVRAYEESVDFSRLTGADRERALHKLEPLGYGLLIHDAYRPWYVTKIFWDATPPEGKIFVADPSQGSRHNRGCAVDLTMYKLDTGKPVKMVGVYDEQSPRSYPFYPGGTSRERWLRGVLRHAMEEQGFEVYETEWWHFDYSEWHHYPILNLTFQQLVAAKN